MNLICFSWEDWNLKERKRSLPLVLGLLQTRRFARALYINTPLRLTTIGRRLSPSQKLRRRYLWPRKEYNVVVFTPCYPLPYRLGKMNALIARCQIGVLKTLLRLRPYIFINVNPQVTELQNIFKDASARGLDMYDDFEQVVSPGIEEETERSRVRDAVETAARQSDTITAINAALANRFSQQGLRAVVLRNAVDFRLFDESRRQNAPPPDALRSLPRPIIGYMGASNMRTDFELVRFLSQRRPQWSFVFLGNIDPTADIPKDVEQASNVHFLPAVPYDQLPDLMRQFDVGIVPFKVNAQTAGLDALKIYHYLAAALPVVSTAVGGVDLFGALVHVARTPSEFLQHLETSLIEKSEDSVQRRLDYARANSWDERAQELAALLLPANRPDSTATQT